MVNDLLRELGASLQVDRNINSSPVCDCPVPPESLAEMINLIEEGTISNNVAKELFPEMFSTGKSARDLVREKGLEMKSDGDEIEIICKQSISENPDAADKFRGGKEGAINALKGAVMKATRGQANPMVVDETLRRLLS